VVLNVEITSVSRSDTFYAKSTSAGLWAFCAGQHLYAAGPLRILDDNKTGFFCSSQCPGGVDFKDVRRDHGNAR
jgi:hypothetical protein